MAARCEMCGKEPSSGHNVSHSNRKTKRRFMPNLVQKQIFDSAHSVMVRTKICTRCLKTLGK